MPAGLLPFHWIHYQMNYINSLYNFNDDNLMMIMMMTMRIMMVMMMLNCVCGNIN